jgi:putative IMPACT (imprinted ancient) family translation regulator
MILEEDFAADVTLTARFAVEDFPAFQQALRQASNARLEAEIVETGETILPIEPAGG